MFQEHKELTLPQVLCVSCADLATKAFLFQKLCQHSYKNWDEALELLNKSLDLSETLGPVVKTAYLLVKNDSLILTSRKVHVKKTKEAALVKVQHLLKARQNYKKVKCKYSSMCSECGQTFHSMSYLSKHMEKHKNKKYPCPLCHKIFPNLANLNTHKDRMHKPKTVQCPKCAKMFSSEKMLKYHEASYHIAAICKQCSMQFPSKKDLRLHMTKHDVNQSCNRCSKKFISKLVLKTHMKICGENQRINVYCDICKKGYVRKNSLRSHLITEHGFGATYTCNWCNKQFDAVSKLNMHIVKHTRERNFHCMICGGHFVTKAALTYHTRIHTGEKPYPCDLCKESFLSASRRMEHKRRKHLGPKHHCTVCSSKFVSKFELNKHMARHNDPHSRLFIDNNEGKKNSSAVKKHIVYF